MEPVRVVDLDHHRLAVLPDGDLDRQLVDVGVDVFFLLPAVLVEALPEVALLVKQAHADQRDAEVGRALDVVAGQDAQAAGIDGQRLVQAELGGEVGHRARCAGRPHFARPRSGRRRRYSCWRR